MPECNYQLCNRGFINRHGNSKYCSKKCYEEEKKLRSSEKYAEMKKSLQGRNQTYASLQALHKTHGELPIPYTIHHEYNIDWGFFESIRSIEGINYRVIGKYGYVRFQDNSLIIKLLK